MNSSCGCGGYPSLPGSALPPAYKALDGMAAPTFKASGVMVVDDNWTPRVLVSDGVTVTKNGVTRNTDGSIAKGGIDLNPELVYAVDSFTGLLGTRIVKIGAHPQEGSPIPDGSTFMMSGGQWQVVSISQLNRTFDPATFKEGGKQLLSLACSTGGKVELGLFNQTPGTVIYIDETGAAQSVQLTELATALILPLCSSIPELNTEEDEVAQSSIVCSQNGLRKVSGTGTNAYYLNPIQQIYFQGKYQGLSSADMNPLEVQYYPPFPPITPGVFASNWVDVDLTDLPGYTERATAVIISAKAMLSIANTPGYQVWHMVMIVGGEERIRLVSGGETGTWNNVCTQFVMPIPTSKVIRIEVQRQLALAGTIGEVAVALAYVAGFRYD